MDAVISELKNIDFPKYFKETRRKRMLNNIPEPEPTATPEATPEATQEAKPKRRTKKKEDEPINNNITLDSEHNNIFGYFSGCNRLLKTSYEGYYEYGITPAYSVSINNGIEVMKLHTKIMSSGGVAIKGWSMIEMKKCLKINNIKGYSKLTKDQVIDLLIKM